MKECAALRKGARIILIREIRFRAALLGIKYRYGAVEHPICEGTFENRATPTPEQGEPRAKKMLWKLKPSVRGIECEERL
jgi:hypothetical protein